MEESGGKSKEKHKIPGKKPIQTSDISSEKKKERKRKRASSSGSTKDEKKANAKSIEKKEQKNAKQWACVACTFLNEPSRIICEICDTSHPTKDLGEKSERVEWSCLACTLKNPAHMRLCAACGSLNPNPKTSGIIINGKRSLMSMGLDSDDDEDDDEEEEEEEDDDNDSEGESDNEAVWFCHKCGEQSISRTEKICPACFVKRSTDPKKKAGKNKRKRKNLYAYGVSSETLKQLSEKGSPELTDTLQTLTHNLAMADASTEWGHASLFMRDFSNSDKGKKSELFNVLSNIFQDISGKFTLEARSFALQSLNYLFKLDRLLLERDAIKQVFSLMMEELTTWEKSEQKITSKTCASPKEKATQRSSQMIVEECLSGVASICKHESFIVKELCQVQLFDDFLDVIFALLVNKTFHVNLFISTLDILQRCCTKMPWKELLTICPLNDSIDLKKKNKKKKKKRKKKKNFVLPILTQNPCLSEEKSKNENEKKMAIPSRIIMVIQSSLMNEDSRVHVKAAKCLFHAAQRWLLYQIPVKIISELLDLKLLKLLVQLIVDTNREENKESRLAIASLFLFLLEHYPSVAQLTISNKLYEPLLEGMLPIFLSSKTTKENQLISNSTGPHKDTNQSTNSNAWMHGTLRIVSNLTYMVCVDSISTVDTDTSTINEPTSNVLVILLEDFIRGDLINGLNAILREDSIDLDQVLACGKLPLELAVEESSMAIIKQLVKKDSKVNGVNPITKQTILHTAAKEGRCDVVVFLLQNGADLSLKNAQDETVMDYVEKNLSKDHPMKQLLELKVKKKSESKDTMEDHVVFLGDDSSEDEEEKPKGSRHIFSSSSNRDHGEGKLKLENDDIIMEEGDFDEFGHDDDDDDDDDDEGFDEEEDFEDGFEYYLENDEEISSDDDDDDEEEEEEEEEEENSDAKEASATDSLEVYKDASSWVPNLTQSAHFTRAALDCLLSILRGKRNAWNASHYRTVMSTLASVLEVAPSSIIEGLQEEELLLVLDTIHFLLQEESSVIFSNAQHHQTSNNNKSSLGAWILSLRILQGALRQSCRSNAGVLFYQIERRGIYELVCTLSESSSSSSSSSCTDVDGDVRMEQNEIVSKPTKDAKVLIFNRAMVLLDSLSSERVQSGALHLHKLKNLARRLRVVSGLSLASNEAEELENDSEELVLSDLVEVFEHTHAVTAHEFKQSGLLTSIVDYLSHDNQDIAIRRVARFWRLFSQLPSAMNHLVQRLQSIITQFESFPVVSHNSVKGREFYPLTRQLKIALSPNNASNSSAGPLRRELAIHSSVLTSFQSFEKAVARCVSVQDTKLHLFYLNLIGKTIQKSMSDSSSNGSNSSSSGSNSSGMNSNRYKKFIVCGYDVRRSMHLLKPLEQSKLLGKNDQDQLIEAVLHDSSWKLSSPVEVHEDIELNLEAFGAPLGDGKEQKHGSNLSPVSVSVSAESSNQKKKRKRSTSINTSSIIEVKNDSSLKFAKIPGAWYPATVVKNDDIEEDNEDSSVKSCEVQLLNGKKISNVSCTLVRSRLETPQVGSVVEVNNMIGEVTKVDEKTLKIDVKFSGGKQIQRNVKKGKFKYPVVGSISSASPPPNKNTKQDDMAEEESTNIKFSTNPIKKLVYRRQKASSWKSYLAANEEDEGDDDNEEEIFDNGSISFIGSIGDDVWIRPPLEMGVKDFYVHGVIQGINCVTKNVDVELSFLPNKLVIVRVEQQRVINMKNPKTLSSSRGLFSSLELGRSNKANRNSCDEDRDAFLQALRSSTSDGNAFEHIRQLFMSRMSADDEEVEAEGDSLTSALMEENPIATLSSKKNKVVKLKTVQSLLNTEGKDPAWICRVPPKINLLLGLVSKSPIEGVSSNFWPSPTHNSSLQQISYPCTLFLQKNDATCSYELKDVAKKAFQNVFEVYSRNSEVKEPGKKKRKTSALSPLQKEATSISWKCDRLGFFLRKALGLTHGTQVNQWSLFSKYASKKHHREILTFEGFLTLMQTFVEDKSKCRAVWQYLKTLGYTDENFQDNGDDNDTKAKKQVKSTRDISLKTFVYPEQNILKCLQDLEQQNEQDPTTSSGSTGLPPWKHAYVVCCDYKVTWPTSSKQEQQVQSTNCTSTSDWVKDFLSNPQAEKSGLSDAIRILKCLYQGAPSEIRASNQVTHSWENSTLNHKLEVQLQDVLAVCSGVYPRWCSALVKEYKFLLSPTLRLKFFRATSFGSTRSLHWYRDNLNATNNENNSGSSSSMENSSVLFDGMDQEVSIAPIPKEKVRVQRNNILQSAETVMRMYAKRKTVLDIVFAGEKGYGSGVTAAFYSAVAHTLQLCTENNKVRCWLSGEEDEKTNPDAVIRHPNGLFPFPSSQGTSKRSKVNERFRFMGRLAGKSLMDDRLLPLPFSEQFVRVVLGGKIGVDELPTIFLSPGKIIYQLHNICVDQESGIENVQIDKMDVSSWLEAVGLTFVDPLTQIDLVPGGDNVEVTCENLRQYVNAVINVWLKTGIDAQIKAFREGISEVISLEQLDLLFVPEILERLCGDADIKWDVTSLLQSLKLAHGYSKESLPIKYFVEVLDEMNVSERRAFLLYATGCPNLPPGGFQALKPPFEVVRRVVDTTDVDQALPFARTCTNTLHLPAYTSKEILSSKLAFAIGNSKGVIDRD